MPTTSRRNTKQTVGYQSTATTFSDAIINDSNPAITSTGGIPASYGIKTTPASTVNSARLDELYNSETELLRDHNISDIYREDWFSNYSRFGYVDPYNTHKKTKEYLFFTKPDLNILGTSGTLNSQIAENSFFFSDAIDRYRHVAESLNYSYSISSGPFVPLLTNAVNSALELPSISADTIETAKNVYGVGLSYRGSSFKSDNDFEFSLDFRDSKFLDVYMYFKMYDEYERMKWLGEVSPKIEYIKNKILHDQFSIYKFIVAEDGMTLIYWARCVGVMPLSVPREAMANIDGELTFSVNFKAQFVYDMDPRILRDFNNIGLSYRSGMSNLPLFNTSTKRYNGKWARCPYVMTRESTPTDKLKRNKYYLLWAS